MSRYFRTSPSVESYLTVRTWQRHGYYAARKTPNVADRDSRRGSVCDEFLGYRGGLDATVLGS